MPLNYKQIFDALSYSVRNGTGQPINVYQALMTAEGVGVLAGYHMRKTRKQMLAATELFYEQRDDILTKYGFTIKNEEIVPVAGEKDEAALAVALAEIDTLADVQVDDIQSLRLSMLLTLTGRAQELLIQYDALSVLEPLIEDDTQ